MLESISPQEAIDRGMFHPVYHGTSAQNFSKILSKGFKLFIGDARSEDVSQGYITSAGPYYENIYAPVHHLGYGVYFTTVKAIAEKFSYGDKEVLVQYALDIPNRLDINFAVPRTMMNWWIDNGYDPKLASRDRVEATLQMTERLSSEYDAVWFKGKGLYSLLDGDQVCVYNPRNIYKIDESLAGDLEIGSYVKNIADGRIGKITGTRKLDQDVADMFWKDRVENMLLCVKYSKGPVDRNVGDLEVVPFKKSIRAKRG